MGRKLRRRVRMFRVLKEAIGVTEGDGAIRGGKKRSSGRGWRRQWWCGCDGGEFESYLVQESILLWLLRVLSLSLFVAALLRVSGRKWEDLAESERTAGVGLGSEVGVGDEGRPADGPGLGGGVAGAAGDAGGAAVVAAVDEDVALLTGVAALEGLEGVGGRRSLGVLRLDGESGGGSFEGGEVDGGDVA